MFDSFYLIFWVCIYIYSMIIISFSIEFGIRTSLILLMHKTYVFESSIINSLMKLCRVVCVSVSLGVLLPL